MDRSSDVSDPGKGPGANDTTRQRTGSELQPEVDAASEAMILEIEEASAGSAGQRYLLRLYVTGTTPQSARAIANIKALCDERLEGRYDLEVIDIYQQPELARSANIIAAPTLVRSLPLPLRRLIGDLSDEERVLIGLGLPPA